MKGEPCWVGNAPGVLKNEKGKPCVWEMPRGVGKKKGETLWGWGKAPRCVGKNEMGKPGENEMKFGPKKSLWVCPLGWVFEMPPFGPNPKKWNPTPGKICLEKRAPKFVKCLKWGKPFGKKLGKLKGTQTLEPKATNPNGPWMVGLSEKCPNDGLPALEKRNEDAECVGTACVWTGNERRKMKDVCARLMMCV